MNKNREAKILIAIKQAYRMLVQVGKPSWVPLKPIYQTTNQIFRHSLSEFKYVVLKQFNADYAKFNLSRGPVLTKEEERYSIYGQNGHYTSLAIREKVET